MQCIFCESEEVDQWHVEVDGAKRLAPLCFRDWVRLKGTHEQGIEHEGRHYVWVDSEQS